MLEQRPSAPTPPPGADGARPLRAESGDQSLLESDLLARCGRGERDAFADLYDRLAPRVLGMVRFILGGRASAADVEDVLQDTMLDLWRRAPSYDPALAPAAAWALMLARSKAIDHIRRTRRLADRLREAGIAGVGADRELPARPGEDERAPLARALRSLDAEQASCIRLAFQHGLTREQIAAATHTPVGTVKTRIRLGVRSLLGSLAPARKEVGP